MTLGIIAGVSPVARLALDGVLHSHCLTEDRSGVEELPTAISTLASEAPVDEGTVISVTQYLPLSSLAQIACLSGVKA